MLRRDLIPFGHSTPLNLLHNLVESREYLVPVDPGPVLGYPFAGLQGGDLTSEHVHASWFIETPCSSAADSILCFRSAGTLIVKTLAFAILHPPFHEELGWSNRLETVEFQFAISKVPHILRNDVAALAHHRQFHKHIIVFVLEVWPEQETGVKFLRNVSEKPQNTLNICSGQSERLQRGTPRENGLIFKQNLMRQSQSCTPFPHQLQNLVRSSCGTPKCLVGHIRINCEENDCRIAYMRQCATL